MDDQAALIARRVAMAAAAWFAAPTDVEAYRRLSMAVGEWNNYCAPRIEDPHDLDAAELLDELADAAGSPPVPLSEGMPELEAMLRKQARRAL